jgi:DNA-binding NtrC family response regulator
VRHSILIAENDVLTRLTITNMLDVAGCRSIEANTQEIALSILEGVWFDTILTSSTKDDPDGNHFAGKAKAMQPHIKVIVMTGFGYPEDMPSNVDAVIAKPFSLKDINFAVRVVLRKLEKGLTSMTHLTSTSLSVPASC